ncbi:hypothetical protein NDN08_004025 [Rhodosorus marinus]|uniref:PPM-type phosphatase domain-containing protein n=1 Tax=Rhodosorus marinus TaxID=101924 RepID=A0AAV8UH39_9RHOD|nr:hypothetical protein NDN08_004025 [Rhodosorus marinus]
MSSPAERMVSRMREYFKRKSPAPASDSEKGNFVRKESGASSVSGSLLNRLSRKPSSLNGMDEKGVVSAVGITEDPNVQWRKHMEDGHAILTNFRGSRKEAFFGVYDGHGGRAAVESVQKCLHKFFADELSSQVVDISPEQAFAEAYRKADAVLLENRCLYVGTTSVTCYVSLDENDRKHLHVANVGDARAVLCRDGKGLRLSYDHKASDDLEQKRVCEDGGQIVGRRVNGVLSVSRALGDHAMKKVVLGSPYTSHEVLTSEDPFVILACDGLWDVMSDDDACTVVLETAANNEAKELDVQLASRVLVQLALKRGSTDNVSVMVIKF